VVKNKIKGREMELPTEEYLDWLDHALQWPQDIEDRDYARYQLAVDG